jgi:hypothetical protein
MGWEALEIGDAEWFGSLGDCRDATWFAIWWTCDE